MAVENSVAQRIIAAAHRCFLTRGYRSVAMDDLAAELGMSKNTLYAHFPSKADLLRTVLLDQSRSVRIDFERAFSECSASVPAVLRHLLARMFCHAEKIHPSFLRDIHREVPEMLILIENRQREVVQRYFGKLFVGGRRAGTIRRDIPSGLMIEVVLGVTASLMNPAKMAELHLRPKRAFAIIMTAILRGMLTERGRSIYRHRS